MPERIQQKRTGGWRKPSNTVSVARPSKWGNPFRIVRAECELGGFCYSVVVGARTLRDHFDSAHDAAEFAVKKYREHLRAFPAGEDDLAELRGKNLMCFCPLDQPCHADVLLELANL